MVILHDEQKYIKVSLQSFQHSASNLASWVNRKYNLRTFFHNQRSPVVKNPPSNAGDVGSISGSGRFPGGGHGNPRQVFLPGESHAQRSLVGYAPWGCKESD